MVKPPNNKHLFFIYAPYLISLYLLFLFSPYFFLSRPRRFGKYHGGSIARCG
jgi:hypothetical protein